MQAELKAIFATRTCAEWLDFSNEANTPIAPVNTPKTAPDDPQFAHRLPFYGIDDVGAEQLPLPVYIQGQLPPTPTMAPGIGEQTDEVLAELGVSAERIAELRAAGSVGPQS
jgi:crotonobetainyl-CoA:carnitine CoA-transferase CaiB-like acyl-CoA transferase